MKIYDLWADGNNHEFWYDRSIGCWYACRVDRNGNLGDSINAYTKGEIMDAVERGLCPKINEVCRA